MKQFLFEQKNKPKWNCIVNTMSEVFRQLKQDSSKDFIVIIDNYSPKKSDKQLRSYWMLINSVVRYMRDQGNNFSQEEVSNWFKIKSGHCRDIGEEKVPKSISNKSETSKEQMQNLINVILDFGLEHNIRDCHIEPYELQILLNNYEEKNYNN